MALALEAAIVAWEHSDSYYRYLVTQEQPAHIVRAKAALAKYDNRERG
jgi:hypothetical protein